MLPQVDIMVNNGRITLVGPYNEYANHKYRNIGGKFDTQKRCWTFDDVDYVRDMLHELFGWTEGCNTTEVTVTADQCGHEIYHGRYGAYAILHFHGYLIATRNGRDAKVKLADGIALEKGEFPPYGGSIKNPACIPDSGTRIRIAIFEDGVGR